MFGGAQSAAAMAEQLKLLGANAKEVDAALARVTQAHVAAPLQPPLILAPQAQPPELRPLIQALRLALPQHSAKLQQGIGRQATRRRCTAPHWAG